MRAPRGGRCVGFQPAVSSAAAEEPHRRSSGPAQAATELHATLVAVMPTSTSPSRSIGWHRLRGQFRSYLPIVTGGETAVPGGAQLPAQLWQEEVIK